MKSATTKREVTFVMIVNQFVLTTAALRLTLENDRGCRKMYGFRKIHYKSIPLTPGTRSTGITQPNSSSRKFTNVRSRAYDCCFLLDLCMNTVSIWISRSEHSILCLYRRWTKAQDTPYSARYIGSMVSDVHRWECPLRVCSVT